MQSVGLLWVTERFEQTERKTAYERHPPPSPPLPPPLLLLWCCLRAPSVRISFLSCEAAAEGTAVLAMAVEKPKEGVKTENNDHINLKVVEQDGSVVLFKIKRHTPLSKLRKPIVNDRACQ
eukprot:bmy_04412T0